MNPRNEIQGFQLAVEKLLVTSEGFEGGGRVSPCLFKVVCAAVFVCWACEPEVVRDERREMREE